MCQAWQVGGLASPSADRVSPGGVMACWLLRLRTDGPGVGGAAVR